MPLPKYRELLLASSYHLPQQDQIFTYSLVYVENTGDLFMTCWQLKTPLENSVIE